MTPSNVLRLGKGRALTPSDRQVFDWAKEADRRIANSLALIANFIRLQAARVAERAGGYSADEINMLLSGMAYRVDAMGELHKVLPAEPQEATTDLGEHLEKMCSAMRPFVSFSGPVELCCDSSTNCVVPTEDIGPIALIVSEMVANSAKYAHPAGCARPRALSRV